MVIIIKKDKEENVEKNDKDEKFNNKLKAKLIEKKNPEKLEELYLIAGTLDKNDKKLICEDVRPRKLWKWSLVAFGLFMLGTIIYLVILLAPQIIALFNGLMGMFGG